MALTPEKEHAPKKAVLGKQLLDKIFLRDFSVGGQFIFASGSPGSGKTSFSLGCAQKIIRENPSELVYWRESLSAPVQFTKYDGNCQVLCEKSFHLELREISDNRKISHDIPIRYFEGFKQLTNMSIPGYLNVVYFRNLSKWVDFLKYLIVYPSFQTVIIDEMEDIVPEFSGGETWKKNAEFSNCIKQCRKGLITLICSSQNISDCDHRVRKKAQMFVYLHGAVPDASSPIRRHVVSALPVGSGWIDFHSSFGQFSFPCFPPKPKSYVFEPVDTKDMEGNADI